MDGDVARNKFSRALLTTVLWTACALGVGGGFRGVFVPQAASRGSIKMASKVRIAEIVKNG
jgi:hypothetical protein